MDGKKSRWPRDPFTKEVEHCFCVSSNNDKILGSTGKKDAKSILRRHLVVSKYLPLLMESSWLNRKHLISSWCGLADIYWIPFDINSSWMRKKEGYTFKISWSRGRALIGPVWLTFTKIPLVRKSSWINRMECQRGLKPQKQIMATTWQHLASISSNIKQSDSLRWLSLWSELGQQQETTQQLILCGALISLTIPSRKKFG